MGEGFLRDLILYGLKPTALGKIKIVYNFGLCECNRVQLQTTKFK